MIERQSDLGGLHMKYTDELKAKADNAEENKKAQDYAKKAGTELVDEELDHASGGIGVFNRDRHRFK